MRWVMTRVLPEPAPARMSKGPSTDSTAARCGGFNLSSRCCNGWSLEDGEAMNSLLPVYRPARVVLQFGYAQCGRASSTESLCFLWIEPWGRADAPCGGSHVGPLAGRGWTGPGIWRSTGG